MPASDPPQTPQPAGSAEASKADGASAADRPAEFGGREGPEPTRFGDWEKGGRCIDF